MATIWLLAAEHADAAPREALAEPISMLIPLLLLGLLPFAFMTLTAFVKISTVLHITRSAIGAQSIPSTTLIMALSAALTVLAMAPLAIPLGERLGPLLRDPDLSTSQLVTSVVETTTEPLRSFLASNASGRERERFYRLSRSTRATDPDSVQRNDFTVVIPAFMVSELFEAFALGFAIYLPFLLIDIIVGNVLMALGMQMMSPTQVSLPFKLLLFVAADGWGLLAEALVTGYRFA